MCVCVCVYHTCSHNTNVQRYLQRIPCGLESCGKVRTGLPFSVYVVIVTWKHAGRCHARHVQGMGHRKALSCACSCLSSKVGKGNLILLQWYVGMQATSHKYADNEIHSFNGIHTIPVLSPCLLNFVCLVAPYSFAKDSTSAIWRLLMIFIGHLFTYLGSFDVCGMVGRYLA